MAEQGTHKPLVGGSNPPLATDQLTGTISRILPIDYSQPIFRNHIVLLVLTC